MGSLNIITTIAISVSLTSEESIETTKEYPDLELARWSIPYLDKAPVPAFDHQPEVTESSDESSSYVDATMSCSSDRKIKGAAATPLRFNQAGMNDLIGNFNLSQETSEVPASRLNEKNFLKPGTNITRQVLSHKKRFAALFFQRKQSVFL